MTELEKAIGEGRLSSDDAIELFAQVQEDTRIHYEVTEMNGHTLHQISFNQTEFLGGSYSNSPLSDYDPADVLITYTFDGESYELVSVTSETSYHGNIKERSSYTVTNSEYLDYDSNTSLFETTDEFTLLSLSDAFEQDTSDFEPGCYQGTQRLSAEDENAAIEQLDELISKQKRRFESNVGTPSTINTDITPSVTYVHEVK
jgi:hypothetical protein